MPNGEGFYKLNWAAKEYVPGQPIANLETGYPLPSAVSAEVCVHLSALSTLVPTDMFVGDVAPEVTEATLSQLISHTFPTMQSVKVLRPFLELGCNTLFAISLHLMLLETSFLMIRDSQFHISILQYSLWSFPVAL